LNRRPYGPQQWKDLLAIYAQRPLLVRVREVEDEVGEAHLHVFADLLDMLPRIVGDEPSLDGLAWLADGSERAGV
jgi:hypothetical protein